MDIKDLTPEQRKRLAECETNEEMLEYAREEDIDIPDELLEQIAGGRISKLIGMLNPCPACGSTNVIAYSDPCKCKDCGHTW